MYQNLIYILDIWIFIIKFWTPTYYYLPPPLPTTTHLYPYLPLPIPPLHASEQFLQGQWAQVPWTYFLTGGRSEYILWERTRCVEREVWTTSEVVLQTGQYKKGMKNLYKNIAQV